MAKGEGAESVSSAGLLQPSILKPEELIRSKRESKAKLSICSKVCYAIGGAPYQITGCALGFFLQIYLLDVVQMDPFYASIILFVGRVWDAITDPLVGFFISKSSWTCFGRLMPWIIFSTPFGVISYFMIWLVPDISQGQVMWYLFFYCIFQTLITCFHVPYSALTMFISREQSERDSATAYRMTVEVLGTVLGTAIQGQIVGKVDTPCIPDPPFLNTNNSSVVLEEVNITRDTGSLSDTVGTLTENSAFSLQCGKAVFLSTSADLRRVDFNTATWRTHVTPLLRELHWLPVVFQVRFKVLDTTFKALHGLGPGKMHI